MKTPRLLKAIPQLVEFEEHVGKLWHRLISRSSIQYYPEAVVYLKDVHRGVGVMFRALGGDGGLKIETSTATEHKARRSLLQRVAGSHQKVELGWRNHDALHLPSQIDVFPERELNRELYLWLAALAAGDQPHANEYQTTDWFLHNQWLSNKLLTRFPGMQTRYQRLVQAQLQRRPDPKTLPDDEAQQELAIQNALLHPGQQMQWPAASRPRTRFRSRRRPRRAAPEVLGSGRRGSAGAHPRPASRARSPAC